MAVVRNIKTEWDARGTVHPTHVDAKLKVISTHGHEPIVQIDTFGSDQRKLEGKVSQTLQFSRESATELVKVLRQAFRL
jgi:hypothetical protein